MAPPASRGRRVRRMPVNRAHQYSSRRRARPRGHRLALGAAAVAAALAVNALIALAAPKHQIALFHSSTAEWLIRADDGRQTRITFGQADDIPVAGDYLGLGRAQIAVFRPSTREWIIRKED